MSWYLRPKDPPRIDRGPEQRGRLRLLLVPLTGVIGVAGSLAASFVVAQPAGAATTLFVSATGSDTNPCTAAAPCATITHALSLVSSGATIEVAGHIFDAVLEGLTMMTIEQWPGQAPAVVDASEHPGAPVFLNAFGSLTLDGLTITGGSSFGAGISANGGTTTTVIDSTITANTAASSPLIGPGEGGGILVRPAANLTVIDSTITGNTAPGEGMFGGVGGGIISAGTVTVSNSIVVDNTAAGGSVRGGGGGGIRSTGSLTVTDSTITGNVATGPGAHGGGIDGVATVTDSTVVGNMAPGPGASGGGIDGGGTVGASIVAANTANGSVDNCDVNGASFASIGYNMTDDTASAKCGFTHTTDKVNVSPDLGPLANNGGPTQTLLPAVTSPAVGVIPSPTTLNGVSVCGPGAFDQRGVARPSPGPPMCTTGAVEVSNPSLYGGARLAALPDGTGYWIVHPDGGVFSYGTAPFFDSLPGLGIRVNNIVGIAVTPDGKGYWLVGSDGGVFAFGDANFFGSMGGKPLNKPVVAMTATPDGSGYWLVASDGGVFSFGDATFSGSMGGKALNQPMVDMATDPAGGYWLVASDGGIFNFGGAPFLGSMGGTPLAKPVVGVTSAPGGSGYWLVASDGGVFAFGAARFVGSLAGSALSSPVIGLYSTNLGMGYTVVEANGTAVGHF